MSYKTVKKDAFAEIEIKKSKFIAHIAEIKSEDEAETFIKQTRKKYYDATHNCSAYILNSDRGIRHSSDDGAYSGAAAEVLKNAAVVEITEAKLMEFIIDYGLLPKLQHLCMELGIIIYETEYLEKVKISVLITEDNLGRFFKEVTEMTAGAITEASVVREEQVCFYMEEGKVILEK